MSRRRGSEKPTELSRREPKKARKLGAIPNPPPFSQLQGAVRRHLRRIDSVGMSFNTRAAARDRGGLIFTLS